MLKIDFTKHLFLSYEPLISVYIGNFNADKDSITPSPPAGITPDVILEHVSWNISLGGMQVIKSRYDNFSSATERLLVVNTKKEASLLEQVGVKGFRCSHDIFMPDSDFYPIDISLKYDAIYTARLSPYKRHSLASSLVNSRMLTGGSGEIYNVNSGVEKVDSSNAIYRKFLTRNSVCFEKLDTRRVREEINKSCCGLALSAEEGAMTSSSEYLLCGRPVVSTKSTGGRDLYYDDYNSLIVKDSEKPVQLAVQHWVNNKPDPGRIRETFHSQLTLMRYKFVRYIANIQVEYGSIPERPERIFHQLFIDKNAYKKRLFNAKDRVSKEELSSILSYPKVEVIFAKKDCCAVEYEDRGCLVKTGEVSTRLDELSGWIYFRLDGVSTVTEIVNELVNVYGDANRIEGDVRDTIAALLESGVVCIADQTL